MYEQISVFIIIFITLILFIDGRLRYDFVSLSGLLILTVLKIIPFEDTFKGFSHPAVITVASVLVISNALIKVGVMDRVTLLFNRDIKSIRRKIIGLMTITAVLSGFMNNIGALAIMLPITIGVAKDSGSSPSKFLMPIAFASLLGGMITSIGTPPNLIVSMYRVEEGLDAFSFFSFAPVGITLVIIGIIFIGFLGWKLIPHRTSEEEGSLFKTEDYLSELVVSENSSVQGKSLSDLFVQYNLDIEVLSIIRNNNRIAAPNAKDQLIEGDIIIVKAVASELAKLIEFTNLSLTGDKLNFIESKPYLNSDSIELVEVVLRSDSILVGRSSVETRLRNMYNINLIAVSRSGVSSFKRLKNLKFRAGDILLIQIPIDTMEDTYNKLGCLPLAKRELGINKDKTKKNQIITLVVFGLAIIVTSFGIIPVQIAFSITSITLVGTKVISPREFYESIEWPTIIMLGSLLPLGVAIQTSGASDTIAGLLINISNFLPAWSMIIIVMLITMTLTNLIGNSASAVLMAPIAISLSRSMLVSPDPLLMSVAIGSASAFMTPIGHQSNMLVMGPGGYKFTDYWKLGLPISILILTIGTPLILYFWPL